MFVLVCPYTPSPNGTTKIQKVVLDGGIVMPMVLIPAPILQQAAFERLVETVLPAEGRLIDLTCVRLC